MTALAANTKTRAPYRIIAQAVDCTNARDGTPVIIYCNYDGELFVREAREFHEKFTTIDEAHSTSDWPDALEVC